MGDEKQTGPSVATLAAGCFWCIEAQFSALRGVARVRSGYSGGQLENPTYEAVCQGTTGHAEAIQFEYDEHQISFVDIAKLFFYTHDPTTLNRQGNDVGSQYRSAIFYHSQYQKMVAEKTINHLQAQGIWRRIVTEVTPFVSFYPAEREHDNYFANNPNQRYCQLVISPKVRRFKALFKDKLKHASDY